MTCLCRQLHRAPLLSGVSTKVIDEIAAKARLQTLTGRYGCLPAEDLSRKLFFVIDGEMRMYQMTPDGQDHLVQRFRGDEFFCMAALVSGRTSRNYAMNVGRTDLLYWEHRDIHALMEAYPDFQGKVLAQMGRQIERERELRMLSRCCRADVKVAAYLLYRSPSCSSGDGNGEPIDVRPIGITAQELGMARETLSRCLQQLVELQGISYRRGLIDIVDRGALEELLEEKECRCHCG